MERLRIVGVKVLYSEGGREVTDVTEITLVPLRSHVVNSIRSLQSFEDQLVLYTQLTKDFYLNDFFHYVETFSKGEESDLLNLYSGGSLQVSIVDDFAVSEVIGRDHPMYNSILSMLSLKESVDVPYSFIKVVEKPYNKVIEGKVNSLLEQGYKLRFVLET